MRTVPTHHQQCREPGCSQLAEVRGRCGPCYRAAVTAAKQKGERTRLVNEAAAAERLLADGADVVYLYRILPAELIPDGVVVVHSHVRPRRRLGWDGFRAWLQEPTERLERCDCKWAPETGVYLCRVWKKFGSDVSRLTSDLAFADALPRHTSGGGFLAMSIGPECRRKTR
jgi:hypothetical protein